MLQSRSRVLSLFRALAMASAVGPLWPTHAAAQTDPYTITGDIPTPSLYGGVGLLDTRISRFMPDGYLWMDVALKSPDDRIDLNFQALPWLETTFRYTINYALPPVGQRALYDRQVVLA